MIVSVRGGIELFDDIFLIIYLHKTVQRVALLAGWAGVDNAWEQYKLEGRKMLVSRAESRQSTARFVGQFC